MKKTICFLSLFYLITFPCQSQGTFSPDWLVKRSSPVNLNAEAWGVDVDSVGNIYWAVSEDMPGLFEFLDVVLYKFKPDSSLIWSKTVYRGMYVQQAYNCVLRDSILFICGRSCRNLSINLELCDMLIVAVNARTGDTLWSKIWDQGYGYEEGDGLIALKDGIYLTGWTMSSTTDLDVALLKLDNKGKINWVKTWGSPGTGVDHQDGQIVVDDSFIYVSGLYNGVPNSVIALSGYDGNAMLAKFRRSDGKYIKHVAFGRHDTWLNFENSLGMTSDGKYLYVVGVSTVATNDDQVFLVKYDKNLNQIWYKLWGGTGTETARSVAAGNDGYIYVGANTNSYGKGDIDIAVLKYDSLGNFYGYKTWGDTGYDQVFDIISKGNYLYLTGKSNSFNPGGKSDAILLKVNRNLFTPVDCNKNTHPDLISVYPNPCTTEFHFLFHGNWNISDYQVVILDEYGKKIQEIDHVRENELIIRTDGYSSGCYLYKIMQNNLTIKEGKLIKI